MNRILIFCNICVLYICIIFLVSFEDKFYHHKTLPSITSTSLNTCTVFLKINDILLYNHDLSVKKFNNWEYHYVICCPYSDFLSCLTNICYSCLWISAFQCHQVPGTPWPELCLLSHSWASFLSDPHLCPFMALRLDLYGMGHLC